MYSKLFYKCTVHIRAGKIFHLKKVSTVYYVFQLQVYAKKRSQKFTAHFQMYCTYRVQKTNTVVSG